MKTRVPSSVTDDVRALCRMTGSIHEPRFVPVSTPKGALPNECFLNVQSAIAREGGRMHLGWAIWELPDIWHEAELHAIWERPDGEWIDLNPRPRPFERVLFLSHSEVRYDVNRPDRRVGNIRRPLRDSADIRRWIQVCEEMFEIEEKNSIGMAMKYDQPTIRRMMELTLERAQLQQRVTGEAAEFVMPDGTVASFPMTSSPKVGRNDPCPCGCGRKAKKCARGGVRSL